MVTPDADRSCEILSAALLNGERFVHAKFGDGAIDAYFGRWPAGRKSCDGETGHPDEAENQRINRWIFDALRRESLRSTVYLGDWMTCSDPQGLDEDWSILMEEYHDFKPVAYEALHMHRTTLALHNFFTSVRSLPARKIVVTSWPHQRAEAILDATAVYIPAPNEYLPDRGMEIAKRTALSIVARRPKVELILLMGGAIAAMVQAFLIDFELNEPRSMISLGSALDPLTLGRKTRSGQISPERAREYFGGLL